ncbi:hypothetical protein [Chlamydia caviae]|uniref:Uncharacterized protein n=1 Tax=Chlamydia caviae (strain ATCC VR-813 / DSM 19441 / 03DC25 / GPIC) TaxID=227941 RepID=Q823J5_CHLCV|nr:hypothetical protein [Chlamydia caviae]AAP05161.1 hypothetical protein CCA_00415 [Chlamydia caviae GPIC]
MAELLTRISIIVLFIWSAIEPFILCHKMRKLKDHYAQLAKEAENTSVKQPVVVERCCSKGSCCSNRDSRDIHEKPLT